MSRSGALSSFTWGVNEDGSAKGEAVFDFVNATANEVILMSLDGMPMEGCTLRVQKLSDIAAGGLLLPCGFVASSLSTTTSLLVFGIVVTVAVHGCVVRH